VAAWVVPGSLQSLASRNRRWKRRGSELGLVPRATRSETSSLRPRPPKDGVPWSGGGWAEGLPCVFDSRYATHLGLWLVLCRLAAKRDEKAILRGHGTVYRTH